VTVGDQLVRNTVVLIASFRKKCGVFASTDILLAISRSFLFVLSSIPFCSGVSAFVSCIMILDSVHKFEKSMGGEELATSITLYFTYLHSYLSFNHFLECPELLKCFGFTTEKFYLDVSVVVFDNYHKVL